MEENLRRAMLISRGDPSVFFTPSDQCGMLLVALFALIIVLPQIRKNAKRSFTRARTDFTSFEFFTFEFCPGRPPGQFFLRFPRLRAPSCDRPLTRRRCCAAVMARLSKEALELQIEVGKFFGAKRLVPVSNVHMMGDIEVMGDSGKAFLARMASRRECPCRRRPTRDASISTTWRSWAAPGRGRQGKAVHRRICARWTSSPPTPASIIRRYINRIKASTLHGATRAPSSTRIRSSARVQISRRGPPRWLLASPVGLRNTVFISTLIARARFSRCKATSRISPTGARWAARRRGAPGLFCGTGV